MATDSSDVREVYGRRVELAGLDRLIAATVAGEGGAVLLAGEPGIGKSRLAEEGARLAAGAGLAVVRGRCRESEGAPPFWPWRQVLRALGNTQPEPFRPGIRDPGAPDAADRFRFFEYVTGVLVEAAARAPLLVVLDDVHRADEASLRLLAFMSDQLWPAPVGLVLAYRDSEVPRGTAAAAVLADLARDDRVAAYALGGLDLADVAAWVAASRPGGWDAARVHRRTGGNPLFVGELIRHLGTGAEDETPPSVRELIARRAAALPEATRRALAAAAVLGREFSYAPVAAVLGVDGVTALELLAPAEAAGLVGPDPAGEAAGRGGFRFGHVLVRPSPVPGCRPPTACGSRRVPR